MPTELSIGLDIGGTKMAFVVANRSGQILDELTVPTPRAASRQECLDRVGARLDSFLDRHAEVCGIGVGVPGPVDAKGGVALHAANLGWKDLAVRDGLLARISRQLPIFVDNDVNCGLFGERLYGVAKGVSNFVYLCAGTGFGGAVAINDKLMRGYRNSEMEIGHISLDPVNGRLCTCGMRGCVEMTVSGNGIIAHAREHLADYPDSALHRKFDNGRDVVDFAESGDDLACHVIEEAGRALGVASAWCANIFNPQLIVMAGGLVHAAWHMMEAPMRQSFRSRSLAVNYHSAAIKVAALQHGALGASALVWHHMKGGELA